MTLKKLSPLVRTIDTRTTRPPPPPTKVVSKFYVSPEFRAWRAAVVQRAHGRCEALDQDRRCYRAEPTYRMFADHVIELTDGGAPFDLRNGQCLCGHHHAIKTHQARVLRRSTSSAPSRSGG